MYVSGGGAGKRGNIREIEAVSRSAILYIYAHTHLLM